MKLSIIVPVYKVEKYLPKCLDSLVGQTLDDYEIILINDGSPDDSQKIIDEYRAKYPGKIVSLITENGGQGRARNLGLAVARGEYIGFADSDDWVDTTMFEKLYAAAVESSADIVLCDCVSVTPDGAEEYMNTSEYASVMKVSASVWNKLFRRELIRGLRFPEGLWYEDFDFAIKAMLKAEKTAAVHEGLYFYRVSPQSTMRNSNAKKNLDIKTILEDIRLYMEENGSTEGFDSLVVNHVLLDSINRVARQDAADRDEVIAELRTYVKCHVPQLFRSPAFRTESLKRKIIMTLNYCGMEKAAGRLLKK